MDQQSTDAPSPETSKPDILFKLEQTARRLNPWMITSIVLAALLFVTSAFFYSSLHGRKSIGVLKETPITLGQPNKDISIETDSANWKTYSSNILTFRYPAEWIQRPIQLYPGTSSIIQFDIAQNNPPFLTIELIPYDSLRLKNTQKTLDGLIITKKYQYENVMIANHNGKRLYDPTGESGASLLSTRVVLDVPEKSTFVDISFHNPLPSFEFQTVVSRWFDPLISSLRFEEEEPHFEGTLLDYELSANWTVYDKQFQNLRFHFLYPEGCDIRDWDESSGDIDVFCSLDQTEGATVSISRVISSSPSSLDFEGGSKKEWFINKLIDEWPSSEHFDRNKISFEELRFQNGKSYLLVKYTGGGGISSLYGNESDYYFSIFNNQGIQIRDHKKLPKEEVYRIMQTLSVE